MVLNALFLDGNCKFSHKVKNRHGGSCSVSLLYLAALLKVFPSGFCSKSMTGLVYLEINKRNNRILFYSNKKLNRGPQLHLSLYNES